ncbi:hypothetical protein DL765_007895 [Monosporascus sp. GIB2]|nr:hypothetical protein DL765_007895 [Monosporascus sp. GIB2]
MNTVNGIQETGSLRGPPQQPDPEAQPQNEDFHDSQHFFHHSTEWYISNDLQAFWTTNQSRWGPLESHPGGPQDTGVHALSSSKDVKPADEVCEFFCHPSNPTPPPPADQDVENPAS